MNATATPTLEIPADVRDNSELVVDYAFMGHRKPDGGVVAPADRDREISFATRTMGHRYDVYTWHDVNPGSGQRCRFDMVVRNGETPDEWTHEGQVVHLFHTEYFTRVACIVHDYHYAAFYASVIDEDGVATIASPYCDDCMRVLRRSAKDSGMTVVTTEPLHIGQHD